MNDSQFSTLKVTESEFVREYVIAHQSFSQFPGPFSRLEVKEYLDPILGKVMWQFRTWMLKKVHEKQTNHTQITVPLTWWDHLKQDHLPRWFVKRYPVEYRTIEYAIHNTQNFICPHDNQAWADNPTIHIRWMEEGRLT